MGPNYEIQIIFTLQNTEKAGFKWPCESAILSNHRGFCEFNGRGKSTPKCPWYLESNMISTYYFRFLILIADWLKMGNMHTRIWFHAGILQGGDGCESWGKGGEFKEWWAISCGLHILGS